MMIEEYHNLAQADQTSRFDRDSPGLERDVPVSQNGHVRDAFMSRFAESRPSQDRRHHL